MGTDSQNWHLDLSYDEWVALPVSGQRPAARYKHAATVFDEKLYITGGSRNGRYLSDFQVFDLKSLTWSTIKLNTEIDDTKSKGAIHLKIKWKTRLLLLAGLSKNTADRVTVWFIDLESHDCGVAETFGNVPVARSGQSVTLFGSKLIMFGGEDRNRRLLNDVNVLDLETMTWSAVETTQTPPTPRFDHVATLHAERYLFVFGGCSHSVFFNDLHVLDLETMEWSQPQVQGDLVTPRAGHAGVAVEGNWFIVGGGDNKSGALETLVINLSKLVVSVVTSVKGRDPLASEGISISSASLGGENFLVTFGGYNGKYYNEVFVMRVKPRDTLHPKILQSPAAAAAAASVTAAYALAKAESLDSPKKKIQILSNPDFFSPEVAEAQIGELQKMLESLPSLEEKVQALRAEKSAFERDMELAATVQSQRSGGIWKWVAG
ncbi:UNVERIFIED_CONTAM: Acyl-CoA-binding domain-containing protein 4 [Sesamum latifolium]|uniref:Acyl-CoA-binding domain-containing protein 4 n=1 Tax=Sesamum latifolium TaxID=2727402 RepID=A0AAW2XEH2_9LAMI